MLAVAAFAIALAWPLGAGHGNGVHGSRVADEPPTRFERFVLSGCSPCVTEWHPVTSLPLRPLKLPAFPRGGVGFRPGEVRVEALRAFELGRPSRQTRAMRLTLFLAAGKEFHRLGAGLVDEEEIPALMSAVTEIATLANSATATTTGDEGADASFRGGSLRIGLLRFQGEAVAYVQASDVHGPALRPVWEVPTTMYLPPGELTALANAFGQVAAKFRQMRGL
jgi:hypothetical protein